MPDDQLFLYVFGLRPADIRGVDLDGPGEEKGGTEGKISVRCG